MPDQKYTSFTSTLEKFENTNLWSFYIHVTSEIAEKFVSKDGKDRRVLCKLNDKTEFQCALMPKGDGSYFININRKIRDSLHLNLSAHLHVSLCKDKSEYGLPMPEEFKELLLIDEAGDKLFHALTPGKQRNLLYMIGSVKSSDIRIARSIVVVDHLKLFNGKINFKKLTEALKQRQGI